MEAVASSIERCPMRSLFAFGPGEEPELFWNENKQIELKNYQTGESFPVTGPASNLYEDCRHQVCTSTFMSLSAHGHNKKSKESTVPDYKPEDIWKEAQEFLEIYHKDKNTSDSEFKTRLQQVKAEIYQKHSYKLTLPELTYGCQLAWRNAARCINRLYWRNLEVFDKREITTNDEMFKVICDHLHAAYNNGNLIASVLVFPQQARMWSTQYFRFACYEQEDGSLLGDPMNRELTRVALQLGWKKSIQNRTQWDLLPIIVQCDSNVAPSWYEIPESLKRVVHISHPDPKYSEAFKSLGLRWSVQPFVADKVIEIGGIIHRCVPFSGWFMETEIGRDLCDVQRYNVIPKLAELLKLDVSAAASGQLNIDRLYVEVNAGVVYSFQKARVSIVDHHAAAAGFMKFMNREIKTRGNTPADWVWLVPPLSGGMSVVFHQEMLNYVVKPRILDQKDPWISHNHNAKSNNIQKKMVVKRTAQQNWRLIRVVGRIIGLSLRSIQKKVSVTVLYASTTGTAESYAKQMTSRLINEGYRANLQQLDKYPFHKHDAKRALLFIITSTFGQGNAPDGGEQVESWLKKEIEDIEATFSSHVKLQNSASKYERQPLALKNSMPWCTYGVCAIGSSAYSFFCGFGKLIDRAFQLLGANKMVPLATCDALHQQYQDYKKWEELAISNLKRMYPLGDRTPNLHENLNLIQRPILMRSESRSEKPRSLDRTAVESNFIPLTFSDEEPYEPSIKPSGPFTKENPFIATVLRNIELVDQGRTNEKNTTRTDHKQSLPPNTSDRFRERQSSLQIPSLFSKNDDDEKHSVRLIDFEMDDSAYYPGDHVYIFPENTLADVNNIIRRCDWNLGDYRLRKFCSFARLTNNKFTTLRDILYKFVDLHTSLRPTVLNTLALYATDENEKRELSELGKGGRRYDDWLINYPTVSETLEQFKSISISLDKLIQILPPLQPRPYSISSSKSFVGNKLQITVSIVNSKTSRGITRKGLCSNYLLQTTPLQFFDGEVVKTTWLRKSSQVRLFIVPNPYFRLPGQENLSATLTPSMVTHGDAYRALNSPLLMFAVGSGIGPFRAFWQELQMLQQKQGQSDVSRVLFMGCRTEKDLLYANEIKDIGKSNSRNKSILTAFIPSYSREVAHRKQYIQDAMLSYENMIYEMIMDENAFIYMCGSVRACQGIESTLVSILEQCHSTPLMHLDAVAAIKSMKDQGRIRQEMFG